LNKIYFLASILLMSTLTSGCLGRLGIRGISMTSEKVSLEKISGKTIPPLASSSTFVTRFKLSNGSEKNLTLNQVSLSNTSGLFQIDPSSTCTVSLTLTPNASCMVMVISTGDGISGQVSSNANIQYGDGENQFTATGSLTFFTGTVPHMMSRNFALPTTKIEVLFGTEAPLIQAIDLNGQYLTSEGMSVTDEYYIPEGLSFSFSNGTISGTPTTAGSYTIEACSMLGGYKIPTCKNLTYKILAPKAILSVNQRASAVANGFCSSSEGVGSLSDPIILSNPGDLNNCLRNFPKAAFKLKNNISLAAYTLSSFQPLPSFYGNFDGNGFEISNWTWSHAVAGSTVTSYIGLFRSLELNSVVKNLTLNAFTETYPSTIR